MDKSIADQRARVAQAKKYSEAILKLQATYCNDVQIYATNLGVRITFGEQSMVQGEPPHHHMAVFLPSPVVSGFLAALTDAMQRQQAMQNQAQQQAPGALQN